MKNYLSRWLYMNILVILYVVVVSGDYADQPKIRTQDGNLIIESVPDRNITIHLSRDSQLFVNDHSLREGVLENFIDSKALDASKQPQMVSVLTEIGIGENLKALKRDLRRLTQRMRNFRNTTRSNLLQPRRLRVFASRMRALLRRVTVLESNLYTDECAQSADGNPCKNGGSCYDGYKSFHCECLDGWTGTTCSEDVDECYLLAGSDLGCQNGADCVNTLGSYTCVCRNGYAGTHCRLRKAVCDATQSAELCGHGVCIHAANDLGYTCICDQGWTTNNATPSCTIDVNECNQNPCHSECVNLPGSFKCGPCPPGYTGNGVTCSDIDECATNNGGCSQSPRVPCFNTEGFYRCGRCPPGWVGDGHKCDRAPTNSCDSESICHTRARCEYVSGTPVCSCPPGMFGHGFGENGCATQMISDPCQNHECKNNGTCVVVGRGTQCVCPIGFMGPLCDQADSCHPNPCNNGGTCFLTPKNKYRCSCMRGTTGNRCEIRRDICGSIISQESGELSYPSDGNSYESSERCAWIIRTSYAKVLNITFSKFDIEFSEECSKDWLQIHDGRALNDRLIGRFCGNALPMGGNIVTSHRSLFFWFRSDNATKGGSGLKMSWISQDHVCGGTLDLGEDESGIIKSPGYPGKTPSNRDCEWRLTAPYGYRFVLRFYEVTLGASENCTRDSLKIFDSDMLLKKFCESSNPGPIHSSSNKVTLFFHTDSYLADSAFQGHYEVVPGEPHCGGIFTDPMGSVGGAIGSSVCLYLIKQPPGTKIRLEFNAFDIVKSRNCVLQKLEIYDGETDEDPLIKRLCGKEKIPTPIESSGNALLIRYEQNLGNSMSNDFQAEYTRICGETFIGSDGGVFSTPNYPNPYYEHMTCTYDLYGPVGYIVDLNFTDFHMSESIPAITDRDDDDDDDDNGSINRNATTSRALKSDSGNYLDVFLTNDNRLRYYRGSPMHLLSKSNHVRLIFHTDRNERRARGLRVEYSFKNFGCGGVQTVPSGNLYWLKSDYCEWIIEAPMGKYIHMDLSHPSMINTCKVNEAGIQIYANNSQTGGGRLVHSSCGIRNEIHETYHTNLLTIILRKTLGGTLPSVFFRANFTFVSAVTACGGNFTSRSGILTSPAWPDEYPTSLKCSWTISAPMGHKIELEVRNFSLSTINTEGDCRRGSYLEIRNGPHKDSPLIGVYCGDRIPIRIPSFTNHLFLLFVSDSFYPGRGFFMTWEQTETGCGGRLNSYRGSIHSPHNIDIGAGEVSCDWHISVAQGSRVNLNLTAIGEMRSICKQKLLIIYDGDTAVSSPLSINCSDNQMTGSVKSSGNQVLVRYIAGGSGDGGDGDRVGLQFLIDYDTDCNVRLEQLQGAIESPNFPDAYPPSINCVWDIRAGRNNKISLAISHLLVEYRSLDCHHDYVSVVDMRNEDVLTTATFCKSAPDVITSEGNRLMVKFVSDYSENGQGFRAEFRRLGCGQHFYDAFGRFESPNAPYSVGVDCDWYIEVPAGKLIQLHLTDLHIESDSDDCSKDALVVKESKDAVDTILAQCQIQQTPLTVTSPANRFYVHFRTSETRSRKYFKANYNAIDAPCGGIFRSLSGTILSPNYANGRSANMECVWLINVGEGNSIYYRLLDFEMVASPNCSNASLEVHRFDAGTDAEVPVAKICSATNRGNVVTSNRMKLTLRTGINDYAKFRLTFTKLCGGDLVEPSGHISSRFDEICDWTIHTNETARIGIEILHLECGCSDRTTNCSSGLYMFPNEVSPICQNHTTTNWLFVDSVTIRASNVNFRARYTTLHESCGGVLTSLHGYLASPFFPRSYPDAVECIWEIHASAGNYIELNFDNLKIKSSEHCNEDFLEVRAGSDSGKLLGLYCSSEIPDSPLIALEKIWIKFASRTIAAGNTFKLAWSYAHVNELNSTAGSIENPPYYSIRQSETEPSYAWRILLPRDDLVELTFKEYSAGLNLYDGFDEVALPVAIQISPWLYVSSSNVLYLTSRNSELSHFKLSWKAVKRESIRANSSLSKCGDTIKLPFNAHVNLSSSGYPKGYEENLNCEWIIQADDPAQHAVFNLFEAQLEKFSGCSADSVRVFSSSNLIDWHEELKICTSANMTWQPLHVIHGTPHLRVIFKTDASVSGRGFTSLLSTACGANMTGTVGTILENRVMSSHTVNGSCMWQVAVHPGKRIAFEFDYGPVMVNEQNKCLQYAVVYDGVDTNAPVLSPGQICNQAGHNVRTLQSSTNSAVIKYSFNWSVLNPLTSLWNLTYREVSDCDGEIRLTPFARSVNVSSPRYPNIPHPHTECGWTIVAPAGETLQVNFIDLRLSNCFAEYVELFDGSTAMARSLGRFCRRPDSLHTTGNVLYLHYVTDVSVPRGGFRANVSNNVCGGTFTAPSGEISSKHYPAIGGYPRSAVCEYAIKVSPAFRLRLQFLDVHLPYDERNLNASDRLEIRAVGDAEANAGGGLLATLYGNVTELPTIAVESNQVLIQFSAGPNGSKYRGFKLRYERVAGGCLRQVNGDSGYLTLNRVFGLCSWKITVPKGQRVTLKILDLNVSGNSTNSYLVRRLVLWRLTFFNDFDRMSRIAEVRAGDGNETGTGMGTGTFSSTDNKMLVEIQGGVIVRLVRVRAFYSSEEPSPCPPSIGDSFSGWINTNALIAGWSNFYCKIDFTLSGEETITFRISDLNIMHNDRSHGTYALQFRDESKFTPYQVFNTNQSNAIVSLSAKRGSVTIMQNAKVSIKRLTLRYQRYNCGGSRPVNDMFSLTSENLTQVNNGQVDCVWSLLPWSDIKYVLIGEFTFTDSCDREYIKLYDAWKPTITNLQTICRDSGASGEYPLTVANQLIYYHAESYNPESSFSFKTKRTASCGKYYVWLVPQTFRVTAATYVNNMECTWEFDTDESHKLALVFNGRFYIEDSPNCTKDYLEVQKYVEGLWIPEARLCGRELPAAINVTSSHIRVVFRTDQAIVADGFSFQVWATCHLNLNVTRKLQTINGPLMMALRNNAHCEYTFRSNSSDMMRITIRNMPSQSCRRSSFSVIKRSGDGENIDAEKICSNGEIVANNYLRLIYNSQLVASFALDYVLISCGGNVTEPSWIQTTDPYEDNMKCLWYVTAPVDHAIVVRFKYFYMEKSSDCYSDYLAVYAGAVLAGGDEKPLKKICGNLTASPPIIVTDTHQAIIAAVSDSSINYAGFQAHVSFVRNCNEEITLSEEEAITFVRTYKVNASEELLCQYQVLAPESFRVRVQLKKLRFNNDGADCRSVCSGSSCNSLEVLDSASAQRSSMGRFCASDESRPVDLIAAYEDALIKLTATQMGEYSVEMVLKGERSICGGRNELHLEANEHLSIIFPPPGTGNYPPNTHCMWRILSKDSLQIEFESFVLQDVSQVTGECVDYIHIKSNYYSKYFCGNATGFKVNIGKVRTAYAEISFHSDEANEASGFHLTISHQTLCNRTYTALSDQLFYENYGNDRQSCIDEIRVPSSYNLNFYMSYTVFQGVNGSLTIEDIKNNGTLLMRRHNIFTEFSLHSLSNAVRVRASLFQSIKIWYIASNKTLPLGCGGLIHGPEGQLANPPYDNRNYSDCRWDIVVAPPNRIVLTFITVNMGTPVNCPTDYVNIVEVSPSGDEDITQTLCGEQELRDNYISRGSHVAIVARKSPNFDGTGWRISHQIYDDPKLLES